MVRKDEMLTLYVLAPLPILAATIYTVNQIIYKKVKEYNLYFLTLLPMPRRRILE
jgi:ATP-binding cassette subfamily B protein